MLPALARRRTSIILGGLLLLALTLSSQALAWPRHRWEEGYRASHGCPTPPPRQFPQGYLGEHYSPEENLEAIDIGLIDHAKSRIDIAMYAFTDRRIASALVRAARRGVRIRIYRDRTQLHDRGDKTRFLLATRAGAAHISVRVKDNSSRNIMHLKAFAVDGTYLRTGSANWSPPGVGAFCRRGRRPHWNQQDNNLFVTRNRKELAHFESTFNRIFSRSGRHGNISWTPNLSRPRSRRD
ncbi:MAG: phospholipase D-like domain-containing protein [Leptospirillia bacterium]